MLTPPTELSFLCLARRRQDDGHFCDLFMHPLLLRSCGTPPYYLVRVALTTDGPYWGWWSPTYEERKMPIRFVYPAKVLLEICFAYGSAAEEERDSGRVVRCRVEEVRLLTPDEARMSTSEQVHELRP